jgi:hypothetical protein
VRGNPSATRPLPRVPPVPPPPHRRRRLTHTYASTAYVHLHTPTHTHTQVHRNCESKGEQSGEIPPSSLTPTPHVTPPQPSQPANLPPSAGCVYHHACTPATTSLQRIAHIQCHLDIILTLFCFLFALLVLRVLLVLPLHLLITAHHTTTEQGTPLRPTEVRALLLRCAVAITDPHNASTLPSTQRCAGRCALAAGLRPLHTLIPAHAHRHARWRWLARSGAALRQQERGSEQENQH